MFLFENVKMFIAPFFQEYFQRYKSYFLIGLLLIFYSVGLVGLFSDSRAYFLSLSFFNLALSFGILLFARVQHNLKFYLFLLFAFFFGMSAEWLGVHTGFLFGDYFYGESLGVKWFGVPIIIGINWIMLTMISASIMQLTKIHWFLKALGGTLFMVLLDILIEPVAINSDYWHWNGEIPISNFFGWIIIAFVLQTLYFAFKLAEPNKVGISLYIIQVCFFLTLNLA